MTAPPVSLALVIPTRNRAALAIAASESLLAQDGCDYHVFVSDNSTIEADSRRLTDYCAGAGGGRVTYLKPPQPLRMATHWNWALQAAMARSTATHFNVHYDRRITKPGHLALVSELAATAPDRVITWTNDVIGVDGGRSIVWQTPWDGLVHRVSTDRVVKMTAQGRITEMGQAFPILSNCAVPRHALDAIVARFGDICDSTAPDSAFTYRFCATQPDYLHFDRAVGIVYAFHRSTGDGFMRGAGGDFPDFMQSWGDRPWLDAAPIPGANLGQNVLFHEYEVVRRSGHAPSFPPIEMDGYLRELASSLRHVEDPSRRAELRALLEQHGLRQWSERDEQWVYGPRLRPRDGIRWLRQRLIVGLDQAAELTLGDRVKARRARSGLRKFAVDRLGHKPAHICGFAYASDAPALARMLTMPRRRSDVNPLLAWLR